MWRDKKGMDEFSAYRSLACGVFDQALADFKKRPPRPFAADIPDKIGRLRYKLIAVNTSIQAGRFLFERQDHQVKLWSEWLGFQDLTALRRKLKQENPAWRLRLAALDGAASAIVREIKRLEKIPQRRRPEKEAMTA